MRLWIIIAFLSVFTGCRGSSPDVTADEIRQLTSGTPSWVEPGPFGTRMWKQLQRIYVERGYRPLWIDGRAPTPQFDELLRTLDDAATHGLDPERYGTVSLVNARARAREAWFGAKFGQNEVPDVDVRSTYAFLAYGADLLGWRLNSRDIDREWLSRVEKHDMAVELRRAIDQRSVAKVLQGFAPSHEQYRGLRAALARHAGAPGGATGAELSRPDVERIRMNLQRWRWMPRDLGERYILVNVPAFELQVIEQQRPVLSMRVIVGDPSTPTPLFSDTMTYVVFSPYWNIPESILRQEMMPRAASDPDFLERQNIQAVRNGEVLDPESVDWSDASIRLRQAPGSNNALGLVKFIFPNHFSVYLHDTPGDRLFARPFRALSHGCVRVEKPVELAEYVMQRKPGWTPERIVAAMNSREEQTVPLEQPLPVHIGYWTAWVSGDGSVKFLDDPYGLDKAQARVERKLQAVTRPAHAKASS